MPGIPFYIVDVFAEQEYAGNQVAVFRNAQRLTDEHMQKIAREMGFSETTFVLSDAERDGGYDVRIFTPAAEIPFAGHPTLGTAWVIRQEIVCRPIEQIKLNLRVGQIPVSFGRPGEPDVLGMRRNRPTFGPTINGNESADVLGLAPSQIDTRWPVQEVSTGMWFVIVPLVNLAALKQTRVVREKYFAFVKDRQAQATLVVCHEAYSPAGDLSVRVFCPCYGIEEDPATGSGNGCLAAYLVKHRYFGHSDIDVRVEQGHEVGRPSKIHLKADDNNGRISVEVGGRVFSIAQGHLL